MPGTTAMTTLWTAAWVESNVTLSCPGEHQLADQPDIHYVITRKLADDDAARYVVEQGIELAPGQVVGGVPARMSADGRLVSTLVADADVVAMFAHLMAPDEQLGTVPAAGRRPILLTLDEFAKVIYSHHRGPGDVLFHREGLPHYDVPSQNADREAWLAGRFDPTQVEDWAGELAAQRARGMLSQRLRILSEDLTDDERMSVLAALPVIAREEEVRILHRGERHVADLIDHDYWIAQPADRPALVVRSHYSASGAFVGAEVIPPQQHEPYLRDQELIWSMGVPFFEWLAAHGDLQQRAA
jgi:hypothetical protein